MDLARHLLELMAPAKVGDSLAPGARWTGISTELGLRLVVDLGGVDVLVEVDPVDPARPFAVRTQHFAVSYRGVDANAPPDHRAGLELCRVVAERIDANESAALPRLRAEAATARSEATEVGRLREVRVRQLLENAGSRFEPHYWLTPYVGCLIGCQFCYAQARVSPLRRLGGLPQAPWGSWVDVRVNAAEVLAEELSRLPPAPIKFCPIVSDPYHAAEKRYRITRQCLEAIRKAKKWPALVLTRSSLALEDLGLLAGIRGAAIGVSLPTMDDTVRKHFEPRAASINERLTLLSEAKERGLTTFAIVQPLLPGALSFLADALADLADSVRIDVLHGVEGAAAQFADPRFLDAAARHWQQERAEALATALKERNVPLWPGELPPHLAV